MTQKLLIILDGCFRLIDCSVFLLREHAGACPNKFVPSGS